MSSPSIKQTKDESPLPAESSKQEGEHGGEGGRAVSVEPEAGVSAAGDGRKPVDIGNMDRSEERQGEQGLPPPEQEDEIPYLEAEAEEELLHPPDFRPFFTLVEDGDSGDYQHPTVHYVFSDDEQDTLTSAALETIQQQTTSSSREDVEERVVLLDMTADGKAVARAASLSPRWQGVKTVIGPAPSWGDSSQAADRGLMLKIAGQEVSTASQRHRGEGGKAMEELLQSFGERLQSIEEIIGKEDAGEPSQLESLQKPTE